MTVSDRATLLLALGAGVSLLLVLACAQSADALSDGGKVSEFQAASAVTEQSLRYTPVGVVLPSSPSASESGFCAQDPTHNHVIDTADLVRFTGAFGNPDPLLDFVPVPLGSGVVDTGELANVANLFGQTCLGMFSGSMALAAQVMAIPPDAEIWGCGYNLSFPDYSVHDGYVQLTKWGGGVGCFHGAGGFKIACTLQVQQLISGNWQLRVSTSALSASGTECVGSVGAASSLLCGYLAAGYYSHEIWHGDGTSVHAQEGHFMLSSPEESFLPC